MGLKGGLMLLIICAVFAFSAKTACFTGCIIYEIEEDYLPKFTVG